MTNTMNLLEAAAQAPLPADNRSHINEPRHDLYRAIHVLRARGFSWKSVARWLDENDVDRPKNFETGYRNYAKDHAHMLEDLVQ